MKILLCIVYSKELDERHEDIGLCSISAFLRSKGFHVKLIGYTENRIIENIEQIIDFEPDIIGFSVYDLSKDATYNIIQVMKNQLSGTKIVIGGYYPTYYAKQALEENKLIDYAIKGEGEFAFYKLMLAIKDNNGFENVPGLAYRERNQIKENDITELIEDLNMLPFPSRDMLIDNKLKIAQVYSSRGCIRKCSFCCSNDFWKGKWRGRLPADFVDELEIIVNTCHVNKFFIIDNSFEDPGYNLKRLETIAHEIINRNLKISYHCNFRAEISRKMPKELLVLLAESGLCSILFGYEAANMHDLKVYNKYATIEDNVNAIEMCNGLPITIQIGFINFNPYSTFESLRKNLEFMEHYHHCTMYNIASRVMIFSGTEMKTSLKKEGLLYDETPFGYNYREPRIAALANYIGSYMKTLNKTGYGPDRFYYYKVNHSNMLAHEKKLFYHENKQLEYEIINSHEARINEILCSFDHDNANWFRLLLELSEDNWNKKYADIIMNKYLNLDLVKQIALAIDKEIANTHARLKEINSKYDILY